MAASTCAVSVADVGPPAAGANPVAQGGAVAVETAGDKGQPAGADVVAADDEGVQEMMEMLAHLSIDADEVPAPADVAAGVATAGEQGVPAVMAVFTEAAIDADEVPALVAEAGKGGGAAALAAVAVPDS